MRFHLLVSKEMEPIPDTVKVIEDYGDLLLMASECPPSMYTDGKHVIVEGSEDAVKDWLGKFDGIWVGRGSPIFQQFKIVHIGE